GRARRPNALKDLIKIADDQLFPPIVRATSLSLLRRYPGRDTLQTLERALSDGEALVRHTAVSTLNLLNYDRKVELIVPLLYDPVRAVRIQAALALTAAPSNKLTASQESAFRSALSEYQMAMQYSADFPSSRYNLGIMYANLGKNDLAEKNYKAALRIDDRFYPAKNNLALLYNRIGRNDEAVSLLREIVETQPELYEMAYSLDLLLAEMDRFEEAAAYMQKAVEGMPDYARIHYNLGLLQQKLGRIHEAEASFLNALKIEPDNIDFLYALADHYIKRGRLERARRIGEHMVSKHPSSRIGRDILDFIDRATRAKN
ncbi:MAG: tetratricopeptide repeat protein, partial [Desulfobacterales bacterium]